MKLILQFFITFFALNGIMASATSDYRNGFCFNKDSLCSTVNKVSSISTTIPSNNLNITALAVVANILALNIANLDWFSYYITNDRTNATFGENQIATNFATDYSVYVTVVGSDGTVLIDTRIYTTLLLIATDNHNTRYEINGAAILKQIFCDKRYSKTSNKNTIYCSTSFYKNDGEVISVRISRFT